MIRMPLGVCVLLMKESKAVRSCISAKLVLRERLAERKAEHGKREAIAIGSPRDFAKLAENIFTWKNSTQE